MLNALSLTLAGFTCVYDHRVNVGRIRAHFGKERTLGSFVRPLTSHSSTSGGASIAHMLALLTQGSLMMFTVKPLVALMLCAVSFSEPVGLAEQETDIIAGLCVNCILVSIHTPHTRTTLPC